MKGIRIKYAIEEATKKLPLGTMNMIKCEEFIPLEIVNHFLTWTLLATIRKSMYITIFLTSTINIYYLPVVDIGYFNEISRMHYVETIFRAMSRTRSRVVTKPWDFNQLNSLGHINKN
jgi:hypothetical protein